MQVVSYEQVDVGNRDRERLGLIYVRDQLQQQLEALERFAMALSLGLAKNDYDDLREAALDFHNMAVEIQQVADGLEATESAIRRLN